MTALIITVAVLFLALSIWRREYALAVFCALLPTYLVRFAIPLPGIGALPMTLLEVLFIELFLVWYVTDGQRLDAWNAWHEWAGPLTLFLTAGTVALFLSGEPRSALGLWRAYFLEPLLFFPMFVDIVTRVKRGTASVAALGLCMAVIGITAVYQKFTGFGITNPHWQAEATRRVTSFYGFPNGIALFVTPIIVLMAAWLIDLLRHKAAADRWKAALPFVCIVLGVLALAYAVSEGGLIGAAAGLGAYGLFDKRLRKYALIAFIAACTAVMAYEPLTTYFGGIVGFRDDSSSVRGIIWGETWAMLRDNPVFGVGLSGYPEGVRPYHAAHWIEVFQYPHNVVLNFWSEIGLMGLAAFVWIVAKFFALCRALSSRGGWIVTACAAAMVAMLVHGLVDVPYFKNDLAFLFWIIVGMVECCRVPVHESMVEAAERKSRRKMQWPWLPKKQS